MTLLRVAIVDDEAPARAALRVLLSSRPDVAIAAECRNGAEAVEVLRWVPVDLLFLDVQMPGLDGFQVVHAIGPDRMPPTVFVTAHDAYALRAFDVEAIDYVLKPFDEARLFAAFDRARRRIAEHRSADWARRLMEATHDRTPPSSAPPLGRLPIPAGDRIVFVPFDDIEWIEAQDQYVMIHTPAKSMLMRCPLHALLTRLPTQFVQIHRSHAVNAGRVREVARLGKGDGEIVLDRGRRLRLSRRYRDALRERLGWAD